MNVPEPERSDSGSVSRSISGLAPNSAAPSPTASSGWIRTYVLRAGRMTDGQRRALETYGPRYLVPFSPGAIELSTLFPDPRPLVFEIGFGMGGATWRIAESRPDYDYLAAEVHSPGVGKLIMELSSRSIVNVRIIQHDAVEVLESMIKPSCLAGFHIFYPDPWPKKRHHKRRLMRKEIVDLLVSRLAPGGYIYFVTDIEEYAEWTRQVLDGTDGMENLYPGYAEGISWRPETKFESRAKAADRGAFELYYSKKESSFR
jgi:tRNA (guanine-N7-)-methyltransferase